METNEQGNQRDQALEALAAIDATRADLADKISTPWFYYPVLGALMAVMGLVYGLEQTRDSKLTLFVALAVILGSLGLATWYSRRTGVTITKPLGPRSKRFFAVFCTLLVAPLLAVILLEPAQPVVLSVAAFLFVATVVGGPMYDASLKQDLRGSER